MHTLDFNQISVVNLSLQGGERFNVLPRASAKFMCSRSSLYYAGRCTAATLSSPIRFSRIGLCNASRAIDASCHDYTWSESAFDGCYSWSTLRDTFTHSPCVTSLKRIYSALSAIYRTFAELRDTFSRKLAHGVAADTEKTSKCTEYSQHRLAPHGRFGGDDITRFTVRAVIIIQHSNKIG